MACNRLRICITRFVAPQQTWPIFQIVTKAKDIHGTRFAMKQRLATLDRVAAQMNTLLVVIAIGLAMLDVTVLVGKGMMAAIAANLPPPQISAPADSGSGAHSGSVTADSGQTHS
jgi:hypothetical protein